MHAGFTYYEAAAQYALGGRKDDALASLEKAFALGYPHPDAAEKDPDLASLRADPRLKQITSSR